MMAGTRYIIANYLRLQGLDEQNIGKFIAYLTRQPGYPSELVILESLSRIGVCVEAHDWRRENLAAMVDPVMSSLNQDGTQYILILKVLNDEVLYMFGDGRLARMSTEQFCACWSTHVILIPTQTFDTFDTTPIEEPHPVYPGAKATLAQIKDMQLAGEPLVYYLSRFISKYFSYIFVRINIPPNLITVGWLLSIVAAAALSTSAYNPSSRWIIISLILLSYVLDCSDGEVARVTGQFSRMGGYIDILNHWISGPLLITGVSWGLFQMSHNPDDLKSGLLCLLAATAFNFLSAQLNSWSGVENPYLLATPLLKPLYWLFPLDLNFFAVGIQTKHVSLFLTIWTWLSLTFIALMLITFFRSHSRQ